MLLSRQYSLFEEDSPRAHETYSPALYDTRIFISVCGVVELAARAVYHIRDSQ